MSGVSFVKDVKDEHIVCRRVGSGLECPTMRQAGQRRGTVEPDIVGVER